MHAGTDWYSSIPIDRGSLWNEQNETESYKAILLERNDRIIREYVRTCDKCQHKKTIKLQKTQVSMKSIPIPQKIFGQVGIDLIQMVELQGYKYILTFCDFFTKWPELIPLPDKKATTIAKELYGIFTRFGCPDILISDRGTEFCNAVSEAIFMYMGVEHGVSSPYHPQTNGNLHTNIFFDFLIFPVNTPLIFKKYRKIEN